MYITIYQNTYYVNDIFPFLSYGGNLMKKKSFVIVFSLVFLISIGTLVLQSFKNKMNSEVESYLINQRGYAKQDLSEIYTQVGKAPLVSTTVIFNDDLSSRYFYRKENGKIYQYSRAPVSGVDDGRTVYKHEEKF